MVVNRLLRQGHKSAKLGEFASAASCLWEHVACRKKRRITATKKGHAYPTLFHPPHRTHLQLVRLQSGRKLNKWAGACLPLRSPSNIHTSSSAHTSKDREFGERRITPEEKNADYLLATYLGSYLVPGVMYRVGISLSKAVKHETRMS